MKKLFHYYLTKVLAEKAGLTSKDAQILAYATQYVDDSFFYNKLHLNGFPGWAEYKSLKMSDDVFCPVQTSHDTFDILRDLDPKICQEVWTGFHMVPNDRIARTTNPEVKLKSYITKENGKKVNQLVDEAIRQLEATTNPNPDHTRALIKLGIALHAFADSWAHDDFSGIHDARNHKLENDIWHEGTWKQDVSLGTVEIGHALSSAPDVTVKWRYKNPGDSIYIVKDNLDRFLDCAEKIYLKLVGFTKTGPDFKDIRTQIKNCLKFGNPEEVYPDIRFKYNKEEWFRAAIKFNLDETRSKKKKFWVYDFAGDWKWFYYQIEAYAQRESVLA